MKCADVNQAELRKSTYDDFGPRCLGIPHGLDRTLTRASGRGRDERAARNFEIWGSAISSGRVRILAQSPISENFNSKYHGLYERSKPNLKVIDL